MQTNAEQKKQKYKRKKPNGNEKGEKQKFNIISSEKWPNINNMKLL